MLTTPLHTTSSSTTMQQPPLHPRAPSGDRSIIARPKGHRQVRDAEIGTSVSQAALPAAASIASLAAAGGEVHPAQSSTSTIASPSILSASSSISAFGSSMEQQHPNAIDLRTSIHMRSVHVKGIAVGAFIHGGIAPEKAQPTFSSMLREIESLNESFHRRHSDIPDVSQTPIKSLSHVDLKWTYKAELEAGHYLFLKLSMPKKKIFHHAPPKSVVKEVMDADERRRKRLMGLGTELGEDTPVKSKLSESRILVQNVAKALFFYFKSIGGELEVCVSSSEHQKRPTKLEHQWSLDRGSREFSITPKSEPKFDEKAMAYYVGITTSSAHGSTGDEGGSSNKKSSKDQSSGAPKVTVLMKVYASPDEQESNTTADESRGTDGMGEEEKQSSSSTSQRHHQQGFGVDHLTSLSYQKKDLTIQEKIQTKLRSLKSSHKVLDSFRQGVQEIITHRLKIDKKHKHETSNEPNWEAINKKQTNLTLHTTKEHKGENILQQRTVLRSGTGSQARLIGLGSGSSQHHTPTHATQQPQPSGVSPRLAATASTSSIPSPPHHQLSQHVTIAKPFHFSEKPADAAATSDIPDSTLPPTETYSTFGQNLGKSSPASPELLQRRIQQPRVRKALSPRKLKGGNKGAIGKKNIDIAAARSNSALSSHSSRPLSLSLHASEEDDRPELSVLSNDILTTGIEAADQRPEMLSILVESQSIGATAEPSPSPSVAANSLSPAVSNTGAGAPPLPEPSPRYLPGSGPASLSGAMAQVTGTEFSLPFALDAPVPLAQALAASNQPIGNVGKDGKSAASQAGRREKGRSKRKKDDSVPANSSDPSTPAPVPSSLAHGGPSITASIAGTVGSSSIASASLGEISESAAGADTSKIDPTAATSASLAQQPEQDPFTRFNFLASSSSALLPFQLASVTAEDSKISASIGMDVGLDEVLRQRGNKGGGTSRKLGSPSKGSSRPGTSASGQGQGVDDLSPVSPQRLQTPSGARPTTSHSTTSRLSSSSGGSSLYRPPPPPQNLRVPITILPNALEREKREIPELDATEVLKAARLANERDLKRRDEAHKMLQESERIKQRLYSLDSTATAKEQEQKQITAQLAIEEQERLKAIAAAEAKRAKVAARRARRIERGDDPDVSSEGESESDTEAESSQQSSSTHSRSTLLALPIAPPTPQQLHPSTIESPTPLPLLPLGMDFPLEAEHDSTQHGHHVRHDSALLRSSVAADLHAARKALNSSLRARQNMMGTGGRSTLVAGNVGGSAIQTVGREFREKADPAKWVSGIFACRHTSETSDPEVRGIREALATSLPSNRADRTHIYGFLASAAQQAREPLGKDGARIVRSKHPLAPPRKQELLLEIHQSRGNTPLSPQGSPRGASRADGSQSSRIHSSASDVGSRSASGFGSQTSRPASQGSFVQKRKRIAGAHTSIDAGENARRNQQTLAMLNAAEGANGEESRMGSPQPTQSSGASPTSSPRAVPTATRQGQTPSPMPAQTDGHKVHARKVSFPDKSALVLASANTDDVSNRSPPLSPRLHLHRGVPSALSLNTGDHRPNTAPIHSPLSPPHSARGFMNIGAGSSLSPSNGPSRAESRMGQVSNATGTTPAPQIIYADNDTMVETQWDPAAIPTFIPPPDGEIDILAHIRQSTWWQQWHPSFHSLPTDTISLIALLLDWGRSFLPLFQRTVESLESSLLASLLHLPPVHVFHLEHMDSSAQSIVKTWLRQQDAIFRARLGGAGFETSNTEGAEHVEEFKSHIQSLQYIPSIHPLRDTPVWAEQKKGRARWVDLDRRVFNLLHEGRYRAQELEWELHSLANRMQQEYVNRQNRRLYEQQQKTGQLLPTVPKTFPGEIVLDGATGNSSKPPTAPTDKTSRKKTPSESKRSFASDRPSIPPLGLEYSKPSSGWGLSVFTPSFAELPPRPVTSVMERVVTARAASRRKERRKMQREREKQSGSQTARPATSVASSFGVASSSDVFMDDPFPPAPADGAGTASEDQIGSGEESEVGEDATPRSTNQSTTPGPTVDGEVSATTASSAAAPVKPSTAPPADVPNKHNVWSSELRQRPRGWTRFMAPPEKLNATGVAVFAKPLRERSVLDPDVQGPMATAIDRSTPPGTGVEALALDRSGNGAETSLNHSLGTDTASLAVQAEIAAREQAQIYKRQERQIELAKRATTYGAILSEARQERQVELASLSRREKTKGLVRRGFSVSFQNQMATLVNPLPDALSLSSRHDTEPTRAGLYEESRRARQFGDEPLNMYLASASGPLGAKLNIYERDIMRRKYKEQKLQARTAAARRKAQAQVSSSDAKAEQRPHRSMDAEAEDLVDRDEYDPTFDDDDREEQKAEIRPPQVTHQPIRSFTSTSSIPVPLLSPALRSHQFSQLHSVSRLKRLNVAELESTLTNEFKYIDLGELVETLGGR